MARRVLLLIISMILSPATWQQVPQRCHAPPMMSFRSGFDTTRVRNSPVVVLFAPVQCANCYNFLKRLNDIGASNRLVKVVVVAPDFESNHVIARTSAAFPYLQIDRSIEGWRRLGVRNFDAWIIDSCGRITDTLHHPSTDVTTSQSIQLALNRVASACGPCQQQNTYYPSPQVPDATWQTKKINAYWDKEQRRARQSTTTTSTTTTTTTSPQINEEYEYYDEQNEQNGGPLKTTVAPQTQIPRPPELNENWPTPPPAPYSNNYNYHQIMPMNTNLPCSAYTDDICYHQIEKFGSSASNCCTKGVYLTDVCVPGKCSNTTTQLCCFQKFLQAKYSCCSDPTQDDEDGKKSTNKFNKCCRDSFVTEDPCCPAAVASTYWSSVYEVCFPNVQVNYSVVRFEAHFKEGIRVIDLSVNRQWDYNCEYGSKRLQYAYLP